MNNISTPPAERDLFSLADASFDELLEALRASPASGPHESIPDRATQIADLILNETVSLIRLGSPQEIASAGAELSEMAIIPEEECSGGYDNEEAARLLEAASVVLGSANLHSSGFETNLLRMREDGEWPLATKMLSSLLHLAKTKEEDGQNHSWVTIGELRDSLEKQGEEFSHGVRFDLEGQGLMVSVREYTDGPILFWPRQQGTDLPHVQQILNAYNRDQK